MTERPVVISDQDDGTVLDGSIRVLLGKAGTDVAFGAALDRFRAAMQQGTLSQSDVQRLIGAAVAGFLTQAQIQRLIAAAVAGIPGVTEAWVNNQIENAIEEGVQEWAHQPPEDLQGNQVYPSADRFAIDPQHGYSLQATREGGVVWDEKFDNSENERWIAHLNMLTAQISADETISWEDATDVNVCALAFATRPNIDPSRLTFSLQGRVSSVYGLFMRVAAGAPIAARRVNLSPGDPITEWLFDSSTGGFDYYRTAEPYTISGTTTFTAQTTDDDRLLIWGGEIENGAIAAASGVADEELLAISNGVVVGVQAAPFLNVEIYPQGIKTNGWPSRFWFRLGRKITARTVSGIAVNLEGYNISAQNLPVDGHAWFYVDLDATQVNNLNANTQTGVTRNISLTISFTDGSTYLYNLPIIVNLFEFGGSLVPTGDIIITGGSSPTPGFLACNGAEVSRIAYAELYRVIGTRFGAGNGSTTFDLPRLSAPVRNATYIIKT